MAIPDMWRAELWHPLIVHLPIGLLLSATPAWVVGNFVHADGRWGFLLPGARLALTVGTVGAWVAVWSGDIANSVVARSLCDPTVVENHENLAWATVILFTSAMCVDLGWVFLKTERLRVAIRFIVGLALIVGTGLLGYVGHLGASLVYQQGAAVYQPSPTCTEFE